MSRALNRDALRPYHEALALHCLSHESAPIDAERLLEQMRALAEGEWHPRACYIGLTSKRVHSMLVALSHTSAINQVPFTQASGRNGEACFTIPTAKRDRNYPMPSVPELDDADAAASTLPSAFAKLQTQPKPVVAVEDNETEEPYAGLTRAELVLLCVENDRLMEAMAKQRQTLHQMLDEWEVKLNGARARLIAAGILGSAL